MLPTSILASIPQGLLKYLRLYSLEALAMINVVLQVAAWIPVRRFPKLYFVSLLPKHPVVASNTDIPLNKYLTPVPPYA